MTQDRINRLKVICDFEKDLRIGSKVRVRWTNSGRYFAALATISKVNAKSFRATLDEAVDYAKPGDKGYPAGQNMKAPSFASPVEWSVNNRVEPVEGYPWEQTNAG